MNLYLVILLVLYSVCAVKPAKILFVSQFPSHSHFSLMLRLVKVMVARGHEVTVVSPYPQKHETRNYKDISIVDAIQYVEEHRNMLFEKDKSSPLKNLMSLIEMCIRVTELTFKNKNVQELLNSNQIFDLVVVHHFFSETLVGFGYHFKAPVIILNPVSPTTLNSFLLANPVLSSYMPNAIGSLTKNMNFWQRLENFLLNNILSALGHVWYMPKQRNLFKKYISSDVNLDECLYNNISLMLANSHISINDPIPKVPALIEIGGFHIDPPKELPKDLQEFLDDAKEGVVLFSMGSILRSKDLKPETIAAFMNAFSKIKQKVLWKFEIDVPEAPPNVKIISWIPQQDVLAHPNVRALITHGGLLSIIETVYYGIPIIAIPIFGEHKSNTARAVINGYAVSLRLDEVTEATLSKTLDEILNNPKYRANVKQRSRLMHDQPLKPLDSAVYWMEHVIRHKGAPHLRSAGLDLTWYQRELVDVISFVIFLIVSIFSLSYVTIKLAASFLLGKKKITSKNKKNS